MTPPRDRPIAAGLMVGAFAWAAPSAAALTVLIPAKLATIAPDDKVQVLALLTVAGSLMALVAAIGFGTLSDRTRTRFGKRSPWMVAGALGAGGALLALSVAQDVGTILALWILFQAALNALIAPLKALLADRVARERLGRVSSVYGASTLVGFAIGVVAGALFVTHPDDGLRIAALAIAVLPLASVLLVREPTNQHEPQRHEGRWAVLAALVPPRNAPDFYWALGGRFGVMLGGSMITTFQLYILTDYAGLDLDEAGRIVGIGAVLHLVASIVGSVISGVVSDYLQRRRSLVFAASLLIATAMIFPFLIPTGWAMLVYATLVGFGMGVYYAVDVALMTEVLPDSSAHSRDLGILNISNTAGSSLGPGLSSLLIATSLGFGAVFLVAMAFTIVGGLSTWMIRSVR